MIGVEYEVVALGHLAVERHAGLHGRHLTHAAHELALGQHDRVGRRAERLESDHKVGLAHLRQPAAEDLLQRLTLIVGEAHRGGVGLEDKAVDRVAIHADEARLLDLLLQLSDGVDVELSVHDEDVVAAILGRLDVAVLLVRVGGVEVDDAAFLIGLLGGDQLAILLEGVIGAVDVLEQGKLRGAVVELLVAEHAVLDEELQAVPLLFEGLAVVLEDLLQAIGHLLGDVRGDLLHVLVALQVGAGDVERDVGRVEHAVQQGEELGYDALHGVGDEHLVAVEPDLVALQIHVAFDAREVEDTGQVEGIIHVEVDPEERLVGHRVELAVERLVVLILQLRGLAHPSGLGVVDDVVLVGVDILAVLPLLLLAEGDGDGQVAAVFLEQRGDLVLFEEVLVVVVDVEDDVRAAVVLLRLGHFVFRRALAAPPHGRGALLIRAGDDLHLFRHHERGVEAEPEVADDGGRVVLVFLDELLGAGEGDLVDVAIDLVGRHAHAAVGDDELAFLRADADREVAQLALELADGGQRLELLRGVDGVRDQLAEEDLVVAVEEFFDDGEDVFTGYANVPLGFLFCHSGLLSICCL